jgi:transcriptional regulator with XRE-family HTH domain
MRSGELNRLKFDAALGHKVHHAREDAGMSQQVLADRIGTSQNVISLYEQGARGIPAHLLPELARVLDKSVNYFIGPSEDLLLVKASKLSGILTWAQSVPNGTNLLQLACQIVTLILTQRENRIDWKSSLDSPTDSGEPEA